MTNLQIATTQSGNLPHTVATYNEISAVKNVETTSAADQRRWRAVLHRDSNLDGSFVFGVLSTGVYCRPSCPARRPLRKNVRFFDSPRQAEKAGLRACLRCKPTTATAGKSALVQRLCRFIEANTDSKITLNTLAGVAGMSRFHLQRVFTAELGISPAKYLQACRFSRFKSALRNHSVTAAWAEAGYSSSSRVYESARARLGMAPSRYQRGAAEEQLRFTRFSTPAGKMLLVAGAAGVCSVQFTDGGRIEDALRSEYPGAVLKRDDDG